MSNTSRTRNSVLNIISSLFYQILMVFLAFFSRRIFIETLGVEYLGISGLFSNILGILSLTELGVSTSITYSMYKLLAVNDEQKLIGLIDYYKKIYRYIALIIFVLGVIILPFLGYIVNLDTDIPYLRLFYFVELLSSVSSYMFVYKTTIVSADQKAYKLKVINSVFAFLKTIVQLILLFVFKSYLLYILTSLVFTILCNIYCSRISSKLYPVVNKHGELDKNEKKEIWSNIKDMFYYKIGGVMLNNTDNILISIFISTKSVGLYSNYVMIVNKINSFVNLIFSSITSSVGNFNATSDDKKKYEFFNVLMFLTFCLVLVSTIGIFYVGEDVILTLTQSSSYLFDKSMILIVSLNYYFSAINYPIWTYRTTTGLFKLGRFSMLACAFLNIVLSIIFGKVFGVFGIVLATLISRVLTNGWFEPYILYKNIFHISPLKYFAKQLQYIIILTLLLGLLYPILSLITIDNLYLRIMCKSLVCLIFPCVLIVLLYFRTKEFMYLLDKVKTFLQKKGWINIG